MSKIGRIPIQIPADVKIEMSGNQMKIVGPKGELSLVVPHKIKLDITDTVINVSRSNEEKETKSLHGLWRVLIFNAIQGVHEGWTKKLDFKGVGFRAEVQDNKLVLNVGFSHPVELETPDGIEIVVTKNVISVTGIDKQLVGQTAANIRRVKPVEPYKGKGIKYIDEVVKKKLGKAAKAATAS